uniref:UDENN domain-containing protein n=1 Tax=Arcella intermedia TaxID=1963864 RepID=A0A6B2KZH6_9EUKA
MSEEILGDIPILAMPDQAHLNDRDYCYFRTGNLYAVACFLQVESSKVKDQMDQIKRSAVQKSVVVLVRRPLYGAVRFLLEPSTRAYFDQGYFNDRQILRDIFERLTAKFRRISMETRDFIHLGVSLKRLVTRFGKNALLLLKLFMLEKKIIFYGVPVGHVCESVMALVSLIPGLLDSLTKGKTDIHQEEDLKFFGLPLKLLKKCYLAPYVALQHIDMLSAMSSYIVGTSNLLFLQGVLQADALVTMDGKIEWKNKELEKALSLSSKDKQFMELIMDEVAQNEKQVELSGAESAFSGSDTWIRNMFKYYTKSFLSTVIAVEQGAQKTFCGFSEKFYNSWCTTENYKYWKLKIEGMDPNAFWQDTPPLHPAYDEKRIAQYWASGVTSVTHSMSNLIQKISSPSPTPNQVLYLQEEHQVEKEDDRWNSNNNPSHRTSTTTDKVDKNERKLIRGFSLNTFNTITKKQSKTNLKVDDRQRQTTESVGKLKAPAQYNNRRVATTSHSPSRKKNEPPARPAPKIAREGWTNSVTPRGTRTFVREGTEGIGVVSKEDDEKSSFHEEAQEGSSSPLPVPPSDGPVTFESSITNSTDTSVETPSTPSFLENFIGNQSLVSLSKSSPSMSRRGLPMPIEESEASRMEEEAQQSVCDSDSKDS